MIDLPNPIVAWFQPNLDNFDLSESGLENVQVFVENISPLLGSNAGHLAPDLRLILNRFVTGTLKKEAIATTSKKRGHGEQPTLGTEELAADIDSENEDFNTPSKKGKEKAKKKIQNQLLNIRMELEPTNPDK